MREKLKAIKNMSSESKVAFIFLICGVIQKGVSVLVTPIFTRIMSTDEFGIYSTYNAWYQILYIFITLRISSGAFTQGLIKYSDDRDRYQSSLVGLSIIASGVYLIIFLLNPIGWSKLLDLPVFFLIAIYVDSLVDGIFQMWIRRELVEKRCKYAVLISLTNAFLTPLVGIVCMMHTKYKVEMRVGTSVALDVLLFTPLIFVQLKKGKKIFDTKYWRHALFLAIPLIPHYLSTIILNQSDRIMISKLVGSDQSGIYSLGYSLAFLMQIVNDAINRSFDPWLMQQIKDKKYHKISKITYSVVMMVAFANLLLVVVAPEIVRIFAPNSYWNAVWVIPPVSGSVVVSFLYNLFADFEFYYEKTYFISVASLIAAVANIVLNYVFIPKYGFIAAGYTTLLCYIIFVYMHFVFMKKICKKNIGKQKIYNGYILFSIMFVFFLISTLITVLYKHMVVRYMSIIGITVTILAFRKKILNYVMNVFAGMKN